MNIKFVSVAVALLGIGIFAIATTSIGMQCYNENEDYSKDKKTNYNFMITTLVSAIVMTIIGAVSIYYGSIAPSE